jgi:hypothetical protein
METLLNLLKGFAPALATAAVGPAGGAVISMIAQKFGVEDTVAAVTQALTADPEAGKRLRELDFEYAKLNQADVADARGMQKIALGQSDWFAKNFVNLLATVIVVGSGVLLATSHEQDVRMACVSFITFVLGYYYGTSQSSQKKTDLLTGLGK